MNQQIHKIISQNITNVQHVSTLSCHRQGSLQSIPCKVTQAFQLQLLAIQFTISHVFFFSKSHCLKKILQLLSLK